MKKICKKPIQRLSQLLLFGFAALIFSQTASAIVVSSIGQNFSVTFDGTVGGVNYPGLSGRADFTLDSISGNDWVFDVDLFNTTDATFQQSRISVLGFATDPDATMGSVTGDFDTVAFGAITADEGIDTEICFKGGGGGGTCNGGGSGGFGIGEQGNFLLTLSFGAPISEITLTDFGIRWQSLDAFDFDLAGDSGIGMGTIDTTVPAPLTLGLIGIGLFGIGLSRKRRKKIS